MMLGSLMEPRAILTGVKDTTDAVVSKDEMWKKSLRDNLAEPCLRNPRRLEDIASFIRITLGE
eukprot:834116-Prorocentrum_lima.AAC.1